MRGKWLKLSVPRRIIADAMRFAAQIPIVVFERSMDLGALVEARAAWPMRPAWNGILAKALALAAEEFPELRRAYMKWPWPHLYEYPASVAVLTVERSYHGEPCVLMRTIKSPNLMSIAQIDAIIREAVEAPLDDVKHFWRLLIIARLPGLLRRPLVAFGYNMPRVRANHFGTFAVTSVSFLGTEIVSVPTCTTSLISAGVFGPDGRVPMRLMVDHRVLDGVTAAKILARLEEILTGPILAELRSPS